MTTKQRWNSVPVGILAALAVAAPCVCAYEIGHTALDFSDPARGNRAVPTEVYYPADVPGEDVPVATPPAGGFQVIAFGHGFVISVDDYDFIWEGLVPAGYLVVLPRTETGIQPSHLDLGLDLAFACRSLQSAGADPLSPFYAAVSAACAVGGHSMGGGASFLAAASDPSLNALFNLAAAETNPSSIGAAGQIAAPALLFAGSHDCVTPPAQHQHPMYAALASDCRTYAELIGASHCQFAEYNFLCAVGESGCPSPTISRGQQHELTLALLRPWLDHFLKGDPQAWIDFQTLLFGHTGITCMQDCAASAVGELTDAAAPAMRAQAPRLELTAGGIGSSPVAFALLMPAPAEVSLTIYDVAGRPVRVLAHRRSDAGRHEFTWDGTGDNGRRAATGCYYCRLDSHPTTAALRVLILR